MAEIEINQASDEAADTVLGEAAVASAALAGAAVVESQHASDDAKGAEVKADQASDTADAALTIAATKPSADEVDAKIDAKLGESESRIIAAIQATDRAPVVVVEEAKADTLPKSVGGPKEGDETKAAKKTWYEKFLGIDA